MEDLIAEMESFISDENVAREVLLSLKSITPTSSPQQVIATRNETKLETPTAYKEISHKSTHYSTKPKFSSSLCEDDNDKKNLKAASVASHFSKGRSFDQVILENILSRLIAGSTSNDSIILTLISLKLALPYTFVRELLSNKISNLTSPKSYWERLHQFIGIIETSLLVVDDYDQKQSDLKSMKRLNNDGYDVRVVLGECLKEIKAQETTPVNFKDYFLKAVKERVCQSLSNMSLGKVDSEKLGSQEVDLSQYSESSQNAIVYLLTPPQEIAYSPKHRLVPIRDVEISAFESNRFDFCPHLIYNSLLLKTKAPASRG